MTNYQAEQFMLEEQFVKRMLIDYDIREITTQRQAKNGTRNKYNLKELPRLRIASFKSGYVRKQNGAYTAYQINPQYKQNQKWVWQRKNGEIYISDAVCNARALIYSPITRLNFILNYYLKNYAK